MFSVNRYIIPLFFLDKQQFVNVRYNEIFDELLNRGFKPSDFSNNWNNRIIYNNYYNSYIPTIEEHRLLVERITERINNSNKQNWHYYGKAITKEKAILLLNTK